MRSDPASGVEQPAAAIVHLSAVDELCEILTRRIELGLYSRVSRFAAEMIDRGQEFFKPYRCRNIRDLFDTSKVVDDIIRNGFIRRFALIAAPPAGVLLIIGNADAVELVANTHGVAERVVVVPNGRTEEFIVAVLILLVCQEAAGNARVPVFAQLVDKIQLRGGIHIHHIGDRG